MFELTDHQNQCVDQLFNGVSEPFTDLLVNGDLTLVPKDDDDYRSVLLLTDDQMTNEQKKMQKEHDDEISRLNTQLTNANARIHHLKELVTGQGLRERINQSSELAHKKYKRKTEATILRARKTKRALKTALLQTKGELHDLTNNYNELLMKHNTLLKSHVNKYNQMQRKIELLVGMIGNKDDEIIRLKKLTSAQKKKMVVTSTNSHVTPVKPPKKEKTEPPPVKPKKETVYEQAPVSPLTPPMLSMSPQKSRRHGRVKLSPIKVPPPTNDNTRTCTYNLRKRRRLKT